MTKFLVWAVVIFAVLFGLRLLSVAKARRRTGAADRDAPPAETMVRCVRCGVFLPPAEATPGAAGPTCKDPGCAQRR
jgi:heme/copper-type cytochrome/quinol oxidase subunit 2